jgi:hypothetical protein
MGCYKVNAKKKLIKGKIALIANEQINPSLYYVRIKGWVGGIAKYLLFLTGVDGWSFFFDTLLQHLWQQ